MSSRGQTWNSVQLQCPEVPFYNSDWPYWSKTTDTSSGSMNMISSIVTASCRLWLSVRDLHFFSTYSIIWNDKMQNTNNRGNWCLSSLTNYCSVETHSQLPPQRIYWISVLWNIRTIGLTVEPAIDTFFFVCLELHISSGCVHDALPLWILSPLACGNCRWTSSWRHGLKPVWMKNHKVILGNLPLKAGSGEVKGSVATH